MRTGGSSFIPIIVGPVTGRAIATPMLDAAEADGRTRLAIGITDGRPEEALAMRAGMKSAYREKVSRLMFAKRWTGLSWSHG